VDGRLRGLVSHETELRYIFVLWGQLKEHIYAVRNIIEDLVQYFRQRQQQLMPTYCDVFERTARGASPSAMKWRAAASKSCCNYLVSIFWLFETWCNVSVTRNSKSKRRSTHFVQHFRLIFVDRRLCCGKFLLEFLFTVYVPT
jgi:hypothetical protein